MKLCSTSFVLTAAILLAPVGAVAAQQNDLTPGPAAGVEHAQDVFAGGTATYAVVGVLAVALIVAAASGGGGGGNHGSTTTTGSVP